MYKYRASAGKSSAIPGSNFTSRYVLNEVHCLLSGHENCYLIGGKVEAKLTWETVFARALNHKESFVRLSFLREFSQLLP